MVRRGKNGSALDKEPALRPGRLQPGLFGQACGPLLLEKIRVGTDIGRRGKIQVRKKALFDNVPEIAWIKDRGGRFVSASARFAGACGVRHRDLIGKTDWDIWPRKLAEKYTAQAGKVLRSGLPDRSSFGAARETSRSLWQEIVTTPLFGKDGRILGTLGIARDIGADRLAARGLRLMARQVIRAREDEKKRISNFLHDELGSLIMLLNSSLVLAQQELRKNSPGGAAARITQTKKTAQALTSVLRKLCFDIRPPAISVSGLAGAVAELAARTERCTDIKTRCAIRLADEKKIDDLAKIMAYRAIQESLTNVVKHSGARTAVISLGCSGGRLRFSVADDGKGFDAQDARFLSRNPTLGLRIMREEAESLRGSLLVESAPGFGTVVKGEFPLTTRPEDE